MNVLMLKYRHAVSIKKCPSYTGCPIISIPLTETYSGSIININPLAITCPIYCPDLLLFIILLNLGCPINSLLFYTYEAGWLS